MGKGVLLPYLGMVGMFQGMTPIFVIVYPIWSLLYGATRQIDPLFLQKNQFVSIIFSSIDTWT